MIAAQSIDDISPQVISYGSIYKIAFSPDGKWIVLLTREEILFLNAQTHEIVKNYPHPNDLRIDFGITTRIEFSPDGSRLLINAEYNNSSNQTVHRLIVWEVATDRVVLDLNPESEIISDATFSSDGSYLFVIQYTPIEGRSAFCVLNSHTGQLAARYLTGYRVHALIRSAYANCVWVVEAQKQPNGATRGFVALYDLAEGRRIRELLGSHDEYIHSIDASLDRSTLITNSIDGTVRIWDSESGVNTKTLKGTPNRDRAAVLSKDGRYAAFAQGEQIGANECLVLYDIQKSKSSYCPSWTGSVSDIAFSPDHQSYIVGGCQGNLLHVDLQNGETIQGNFNPCKSVTKTASIGQKDRILLRDADGVHICDLKENKILRDLTLQLAAPFRAITHEGNLWIAYGTDKNVNVPILFNWDASIERTFKPSFENTIYSIDVDDRFTYFAAASSSQLRVWEISSQKLLFERKFSSPNVIYKILFSPNGKTLLYRTTEGLTLCGSRTGEIISQTAVSGRQYNFTFYPNSEWLLVCTDRLSFLSAQSMETAFSLDSGESSYDAAAFTTDGSFLFAGTNNDRIELWRVKDGTLLRTFGNKFGTSSLAGLHDTIRSIALTPDQKWMIASNAFGTAKAWPLYNFMFENNPQETTATTTAFPTQTPTPFPIQPTPTEAVIQPGYTGTPRPMPTPTFNWSILTQTPYAFTPTRVAPAFTPTARLETATPNHLTATPTPHLPPVRVEGWKYH